MWFQDKKQRPSEMIARTGFVTSMTSYVGFWVLDALRPGFVARYVSVHVFLVAAVTFGAWWLAVAKEQRDRLILHYLFSVVLGAILAVVTWRVGLGFGAFRILMTVLAALTPPALVALIRHT